MVDLARPRPVAFTWADLAGCPNARPANPTPDATSIARRLRAGAGESIELRIIANLQDLRAVVESTTIVIPRLERNGIRHSCISRDCSSGLACLRVWLWQDRDP